MEYDREADALYVYARENPDGAVSRQIELQDGGYAREGEHARTVEVESLRIYVDVDSAGNNLGVVFLSIEAFSRHLIEHGGLELPEYFSGPESLVPS